MTRSRFLFLLLYLLRTGEFESDAAVSFLRAKFMSISSDDTYVAVGSCIAGIDSLQYAYDGFDLVMSGDDRLIAFDFVLTISGPFVPCLPRYSNISVDFTL